jgi:serine/threonine protein kinase
MRSPSPSPAPSTAAPQERPLTGTVLAARYELRALLGRGGMGEVYEAADPVLDRTVAVKVLRPDLAGDVRSGARFEREARTAARLSHPRIVAVFDAGRHDDRVFIVMEHVAGSTLVEVLRRHGTIAPATAAAIAADIAEALTHAHERGVVHRDVTPGNVMLDRDGRAKVLDFGIARAAQRVPSSTSVHGTIAYAAPEVLAGQHGDQRVDVYGLGAVLYELLAGNPPFRGGDDDIDRRLSVRRPVPVRGWNAALPEELDALVQRLVAYDPAERPSELGDVARSLREIAASPTAAVTAPLITGSDDRVAEPRAAHEAFPSTPELVARTRQLDDAPSPQRERSRDSAPGGRRWSVKLARGVAWIALLGAISGAGAIVVPSVIGVAKPVQATVDAPSPLPPPRNLTVSTSCDGLLSTGANLAWEPVAGASGYEIWRRGTGDDTFEPAGTVGSDVTSVRDPDLGIDTTYTYRVRGMDGRIAGTWSAAAVAATPLFCLT